MQPLQGSSPEALTPFLKKLKIFFLVPIAINGLKFLTTLFYFIRDGYYYYPLFEIALIFLLIILPILLAAGAILFARTKVHIAIAAGAYAGLYLLSVIARLFVLGYFFGYGVLEFLSLLTFLGAIALMIISLVALGSGRGRVRGARNGWSGNPSGAFPPPASPMNVPSRPTDDFDWQMKQLERLAALHKSGALTKTEFTKKKREILGKDAD